MHGDSDAVDFRLVVSGGEFVGERGGAEDDGRYAEAGEVGGQDEVEGGVGEGGEGAEVQREVETSEEGGVADGEGGGVGALVLISAEVD